MNMPAGWHAFVWWSWPGTVALYGALALHLGLGLWAFYARRHRGWRAGEVWQLALGLAIPPLLVAHIVGTRLSAVLFHTINLYGEQFVRFTILDPGAGVQQVTVLVLAWVHGCIGLHYWLRLKRFYPRLAPVLLGLAVAVPLLALLGFLRGAMEIQALFADPAWRAANWTPRRIGTEAQIATLDAIRRSLLLAYFAMLGLVLLARLVRVWRERAGAGVTIIYPGGTAVRVPLGHSVLEASWAGNVPHANVCGGRGRCSTCRIQIIAGAQHVPPPSPEEAAVLRRIGAGPAVRLACQARPLHDIKVLPLLPAHGTQVSGRHHGPVRGPEERFIVVMVVDMRNSTAMAEHRMPFDTVFIVDRFVDAIGRAIKAAGGRPNQFTGDGVFALFGLEVYEPTACRQALAALAGIGRNVDDMNEALGAAPGVPVRFGVGVQGGTAVVGEIGFDTSRIFTALGDPANVASRLEKLSKTYGAEAVVADAVCRAGGLGPDRGRIETVEVAGREGSIAVRVVMKAAGIAEVVAAL